MSIEKLLNLIKSKQDVTGYFIAKVKANSIEVISLEEKSELDSELLSRITDKIYNMITLVKNMGVLNFSLRFYLENRVIHILLSGNFIAVIIRKKHLTKDLEDILEKLGEIS